MPTFDELKKRKHVANHPLFANMEQRVAGMRANMQRQAQHELDLMDIFSRQKQIGLKPGDRSINAYIQQAAVAADQALSVLDFPLPPKINYNSVKNVKHARYDENVVIDADVLFNVRFATTSGAVRQFVMPVRINNGEVIPPSTMIFEDRMHVLGQSTVNTIVQRNTSYALEPLRKDWYTGPLRGSELDVAAEYRNTNGYRPREFSGENLLTRTIGKKAYFPEDRGTPDATEAFFGARVMDDPRAMGTMIKYLEEPLTRNEMVDRVEDYFGASAGQETGPVDYDLLVKLMEDEFYGEEDGWYELRPEYRKYRQAQTNMDPVVLKWYKLLQASGLDLDEALTKAKEYAQEEKGAKKRGQTLFAPSTQPSVSLPYEVGDAVIYETTPGIQEIAVVTERIADLFQGRPGFSGIDPQTGMETAGYEDTIVQVIPAAELAQQVQQRSAQMDDEEFDDVEEEAFADPRTYPGTKTPMESGDKVKWQGGDGPMRGKIVEIDPERDLLIVNSKGTEYRVHVDDIEVLPSTHKKMYQEANVYKRLARDLHKDAGIWDNIVNYGKGVGKGIVNDIQNIGGFFGIGEGGMNSQTIQVMDAISKQPGAMDLLSDAYYTSQGDLDSFVDLIYQMFAGVYGLNDPNVDWSKLGADILEQLTPQLGDPTQGPDMERKYLESLLPYVQDDQALSDLYAQAMGFIDQGDYESAYPLVDELSDALGVGGQATAGKESQHYQGKPLPSKLQGDDLFEHMVDSIIDRVEEYAADGYEVEDAIEKVKQESTAGQRVWDEIDKIYRTKEAQFFSQFFGGGTEELNPGTRPSIQLEQGQEGDWGQFPNQATQLAYDDIVNNPSNAERANQLAAQSLNSETFARQLESDPTFGNVYSEDVVMQPIFGKSEYQTMGDIDWNSVANALLQGSTQLQQMVTEKQGQTTENTVQQGPAAKGFGERSVETDPTILQDPSNAPRIQVQYPPYQGTGDPTADLYRQIAAQPQIMEMVKYAMEQPYTEDQVLTIQEAAMPLVQSLGINGDAVDWYALTNDLISYVGFDVQEVNAKKVAKIMAKHFKKAGRKVAQAETDPKPGAVEEIQLQRFTPPGYDVVLGDMVMAEEEGLDTFPRTYAHVEKNYILRRVNTASKDHWFPHLLNDGFVINPFGTSNRGRPGNPNAQNKLITAKKAEKTQVGTWGGKVDVELDDGDPMVFHMEGGRFYLQETDVDYDTNDRSWVVKGDDWSGVLAHVYEFADPKYGGVMATTMGVEREDKLGTDPRLVAAQVLAETL